MRKRKFKLTILIIAVFVAFGFQGNTQIKNPLKKLKTSSENRANNEIDEGIEKSLDKVEQGIGRIFKKEDKNSGQVQLSNQSQTQNTNQDNTLITESESPQDQLNPPDQIKLFTKYDFVPGDIVIFEDNMINEQNGEFPSKWDLKTGNVEIANLGGEAVINFPSVKNAVIVPLIKEKGDYLPEKFTIEFDAYFSEFCTRYTLNLYDLVNQKNPEKLPEMYLSPKDIFIMGKGKTDFEESKNYPYWQRVAISFNVRSLKIYFGEQRIANIPNLQAHPTGFTLGSKQCHDGQFSCIRNIRIAKGSMNLYERVITDGKFITNGIRFDVDKATIKPESMGVINQILKLMNEHTDLNFSVEGHTDSDGEDAVNQKLSEDRAAAVKKLLTELEIDSGRLEVKGFGESKPVDSNTTPEGKANNRRVEFIKI